MPLSINLLPPATVVKEATRQLHTEVEDLLVPALEQLSSRAGYARVLNMFYGYFFPLENCIQQYLTTEHLPDIWERRKASLILQDLSALGYPTDAIPLCRQLPQITGPAEALGALYVLEGSTLGGKMIAKMLRKNEVLSLPETATRFFEGYVEDTGKMWKSFLAFFNAQPNPEPLVQSANDTFLHLKSWMQHTLYHD